jgi:hypothetical protein
LRDIVCHPQDQEDRLDTDRKLLVAMELPCFLLKALFKPVLVEWSFVLLKTKKQRRCIFSYLEDSVSHES